MGDYKISDELSEATLRSRLECIRARDEKITALKLNMSSAHFVIEKILDVDTGIGIVLLDDERAELRAALNLLEEKK